MNEQSASSNSNRLDWIIFGLRWLLILVGILVFTAGHSPALGNIDVPPQLMLASVVIAALYNLLIALLLLANASGPVLQTTTVIVDAALAMLFFWASGAAPLIMLGAGLLPVTASTLRQGSAMSLGIAFVIGVGDLILLALMGAVATHATIVIAGMLFLLLVAVLISFAMPGAAGAKGKGDLDQQALSEKLTKSARDRARAIYEMASTLGATLDYNKVLDAALDVGVLGLREMGTEDRLVGMVLLFEKENMHIVTSRRLTRQDEKLKVSGKTGILGQALRQAEPVFASGVNDDPELKYFAAFQDAKSVLVIPLRAGFDNYGLLVFGTPQAGAFSGEHIELLTAIGTQATIALQNAVLYQNLREEKERIVEVEEDARKKLARDLHDGPTQSIAAIAMRVNYIRRLMEKKPEEADGELQKVEELARKTTKEIRHMLFTLRPLVLETQGLAPALQQFAQKMKETHDLDVIVQLQQGADELLETHAQGVLFYIVEEAVGNARKHAQAAHIYVRLYRRENYVTVEIQDDGVGFDIDAVTTNYDQRGSLGMVNMRERATLVEGILKLDSAKGKGTKISVLVPLKNAPPELPRDTQPKRPQMTDNAQQPNMKMPK